MWFGFFAFSKGQPKRRNRSVSSLSAAESGPSLRNRRSAYCKFIFGFADVKSAAPKPLVLVSSQGCARTRRADDTGGAARRPGASATGSAINVHPFPVRGHRQPLGNSGLVLRRTHSDNARLLAGRVLSPHKSPLRDWRSGEAFLVHHWG